MRIPEGFERLASAGVIAVIRADTVKQTVQVVGALLEGGISTIELTFTIPEADRALAEVRSVYGANVLLGAGTIRRPEQVDSAVQAGAEFLVTPHTHAHLIQTMLESGVPCIPGALTPSEVAEALDLGAEVIKLFPASTVGPAYLKSLRGPFPDLLAVPTGGIQATDFSAWFAAGALALGVGSELAPRSLIRENRWKEITGLAATYTQAARDALAPESGATDRSL